MEDASSTQDPSWLLKQLADLIAREGSERFLASPIVEPTPRFFPDRWTPDVEGARLIALRLMAYAGLPELDAHMEWFTNEAWCPSQLASSGGHLLGEGSQPAALFAGVLNGVCYFGVDETKLGTPGALVGVLAHEVAHAWRRTKRLEVDDRQIEEMLTDLTTVYLGFGILTSNAAYRYSVGHTYYAHETIGYLGLEALCHLLAIQCCVRDEDPRRIRKLLDPPQADSFQAAWETLDGDRLVEALPLPPGDQWPQPVEAAPGPLRATLSSSQRQVLALAERESANMDPGSGLFVSPVSCDFAVTQLIVQQVCAWGYFGAGARCWAGLQLVEVPRLAYRLLIVVATVAGGTETRAYGLLAEGVATQRKRLVPILKRLFVNNGGTEAPLLIGLPSFVLWTTKAPLRLGDLQELMFMAVRWLDLERFEEAVEELERYQADFWARDSIAREPLPCPRSGAPAKALTRRAEFLLKRWWALASDPDMAGEMADRVDRLTWPEQT